MKKICLVTALISSFLFTYCGPAMSCDTLNGYYFSLRALAFSESGRGLTALDRAKNAYHAAVRACGAEDIDSPKNRDTIRPLRAAYAALYLKGCSLDEILVDNVFGSIFTRHIHNDQNIAIHSDEYMAELNTRLKDISIESLTPDQQILVACLRFWDLERINYDSRDHVASEQARNALARLALQTISDDDFQSTWVPLISPGKMVRDGIRYRRGPQQELLIRVPVTAAEIHAEQERRAARAPAGTNLEKQIRDAERAVSTLEAQENRNEAEYAKALKKLSDLCLVYLRGTQEGRDYLTNKRRIVRPGFGTNIQVTFANDETINARVMREDIEAILPPQITVHNITGDISLRQQGRRTATQSFTPNPAFLKAYRAFFLAEHALNQGIEQGGVPNDVEQRHADAVSALASLCLQHEDRAFIEGLASKNDRFSIERAVDIPGRPEDLSGVSVTYTPMMARAIMQQGDWARQAPAPVLAKATLPPAAVTPASSLTQLDNIRLIRQGTVTHTLGKESCRIKAEQLVDLGAGVDKGDLARSGKTFVQGATVTVGGDDMTRGDNVNILVSEGGRITIQCPAVPKINGTTLTRGERIGVKAEYREVRVQGAAGYGRGFNEGGVSKQYAGLKESGISEADVVIALTDEGNLLIISKGSTRALASYNLDKYVGTPAIVSPSRVISGPAVPGPVTPFRQPNQSLTAI